MSKECFYKNLVDLTPSPELSYLLGVRYGDMRITKYLPKKQFLMSLIVKDYDFVEEFRRCCCAISGKLPTSIWIEKNGYYGWGYFGKMLYEYLNFDFSEHRKMINEHPEDFLRGFWDSEGSYQIVEKSHHRGISCSGNNEERMRNIQNVMEGIGYRTHLYKRWIKRHHFKNGKDGFMFLLNITNIKDIVRFTKEIGFSIGRKQNKLENWVNEYLKHDRKTSGWRMREELRKYWGG
jgi:intein-encoded DNA endonuclease-like protein